MYGLDGGMCPPFQGNPWTNAEDPTGPFWVVYGKEEGIGGLSPQSMPPRGLVLDSRLRGASQI